MSLIDVRIEGTAPLLCNRFYEEAAQRATSGTTTVLTGSRGTPREQCEPRLYKDEEGHLGIPQPNVLACIIAGGSFFKAGKSKITTKQTSILCSCLDLQGVFIPLDHKEPWTIDERAVRIPSTGGRVLCYRPRFNDWALSFKLELDTSMIATKLLRDIVDTAGKRVGLGDFRPATKGPFGKFVVSRWDEIEA